METKKIVQKAMSPEEQDILSNVKSLVTQLESMGTVMEASEDEEKILGDPNETEEAPVMMAKATASEDAEERVDGESDKPPETKEAEKLMKAINETIVKNVSQAITKLTEKIQSQDRIIKSQGRAIDGILDGLGVTDNIRKSVTPVKETQADEQKILKALASLINGGEREVRKDRGFAPIEKSEETDTRQGIGSVLSEITRGM